MEFFSQDMNNSDSSDGCLFGGKADICKEFSCHSSKQLADDISEAQPVRINNSKRSMEKEMAKQTSSVVVSADAYKTLMDNLYMARMWLLRARNITTNQLGVYEHEAIEHMREIKRLIDEESDNPEASAESLANELVEVGTEVVRKQLALNRVEMEELVKNLDSLLNTLKSDVKAVKGSTEPEYVESEQSSFMDLVFDYGHWCLYVLYVAIILIVGLFHYLPVFEEYL